MPRKDAGRSMSLTSQESYSAVIIADMVAEIPNPPDQLDVEQGRKNSAKFENVTSSPARKEAVNLGFDNQTESPPSAVVNVDTMDAVNAISNRANGTDISKGVVLNAQFGPSDKKTDNFISEKSIEMNNAHPVQASDAKKEPKAEVPTDFKHMSGPRKVAFIFSFLPSIMFVLCFAVILPCEKKLPCIQEMWSLTLNDTEITSRLQVSSEKLFYSYVHIASGSSGLIGRDVATGNQVLNTSVNYVPRLKGCGKFIENSSDACLITDRIGLFDLFQASSGSALRQLNVNSNDSQPLFRNEPVILPDCLGDGISEYGFAVSENEIKIVYHGYIPFTVSVPSCDSKPENLTPWTRKDNGTDLVFTCRKDGKDQLIKMPQNAWCPYKSEATNESEAAILDTAAEYSLDGVTILPTPSGLIVWDQDKVSFFDINGSKNWTTSSDLHFNFNRFLFHGKFNGAGSQIALFSNNASSTLQVSLLDYETGKMTWNKTITNAEISDISLMKGEKNDFVLMLLRKVERDLKAEAVSHLTEVPTTIISLLSENSVGEETDAPKTTLVDEVMFMELGSNYYQTIDEKRMKYDEGKFYKGNITVVSMPNNEIAIVILKQSKLTFPLTILRSISVSNWDISITENRQCSWSA